MRIFWIHRLAYSFKLCYDQSSAGSFLKKKNGMVKMSENLTCCFENNGPYERWNYAYSNVPPTQLCCVVCTEEKNSARINCIVCCCMMRTEAFSSVIRSLTGRFCFRSWINGQSSCCSANKNAMAKRISQALPCGGITDLSTLPVSPGDSQFLSRYPALAVSHFYLLLFFNFSKNSHNSIRQICE